MAFKVNATVLGTDTTIFETPVAVEGSMHSLVFSNTTGSAVPLTVKFFDASTGVTTTVLSGYSVAANGQYTWPKPIDLNSGDKIIATGVGITALQSTFINEATVSRSFNHQGAYSGVATYSINDVVSSGGSSYVSLIDNNTSSPPGINWGLLASIGQPGVDGEISLSGTQTLTNKTIAFADNTLTGVQPYDADTAKTDVANSWTAQQTFKELKETAYELTGTDIDPVNGTLQYKTLSANTTFTESLESGQYVLLMVDDGTAYSITWPTIVWTTDAGTAPTLNTSGYTSVVLWKLSTTLYGARVGDA